MIDDIGSRRSREEALRFQAQLLDQVGAAVIATDSDGVVIHWNQQATVLFGWSRDEALGRNIRDLAVSPRDPVLAEAILGRFAAGGRWEGEVIVRHKDGGERLVHLSNAPILDDSGAVSGVVSAAIDVSERKALEEQLAHQAFHDPLTGLPNRALFHDRLEHALERAAHRAEVAAVLFVDLDNFKVVNDSLGHTAGDRLLVSVAERLRGCVPPGDTIARFGGDEFVVLLEEVTDETEAERLADRIIAALRSPFLLEEQEVFVTPSIGMALAGTGDRPDTLLLAADLALYEAKRAGKARHVVFEPGMQERAQARLRLEGELRRALADGQLVLEYQPLVDLVTGRVEEVEALVRWEHPDRGVLSPDAFIAIAEETGLIVPLGQWVLAEACRQVRVWHGAQTGLDRLGLSVNLSLGQVRDPQLVADVARILQETGLPSRLLTLEITESVAMDDAQIAETTLRALKGLGVRLAVDDFGTGYSALSYLRRCPIDVLKIDGSYVAGLGRDVEDETMVRAIVAFAQAMSLEVTAEGIETSAQLSELRTLGCKRGQGFFFAPPLPAVAAAEFLTGPVRSAMVVAVTPSVNGHTPQHTTLPTT